jgi:hypothetical protein
MNKLFNQIHEEETVHSKDAKKSGQKLRRKRTLE